MAKREGRRAMWALKTIAAGLTAATMALAASAGIAVADPATGPGGLDDPAVTDYIDRVNSAVEQFTDGAPSAQSDQQFRDQMRAASDELRDALMASIANSVDN